MGQSANSPIRRRQNATRFCEVVLTNAKIVTRSECFNGTVQIVDGMIADISTGLTTASGALDVDGDHLLPGLIDVHTDHLEKQILPRAGVTWDPLAAAVAHDIQLCAAGTTTVFDSLIVGAMGNPERRRLLPIMLEGLGEARRHGLLRADHLLHLRCDAREPKLVDLFLAHADHPELRFVTIMDDSPRRDPNRFRYLERRKNTPEVEIEAAITAVASTADCTEDNRRRLVAHCRARGLPFASHDDTTAAQIAEAVTYGLAISEFPITLAAAKAARAAGMTIIVGGPNLVAGRSHIGNVSVRELAQNGLIDIISSDYIPASILRAIWYLAGQSDGPTLAEAVALGSLRPAEAFGLADRGEIATGKRADLVRVADRAGPIVRAVWTAGRQVL
ncbi:alpha-D-ribose 1-methylphosphonate 5-triphosphate diphosphatase [Bradyrhizobium hipponense]|uniref:Alpha-D-ribose 1-methylphosphonate 5-triphosphate diphosphatase n=1 Tax=Bradyrhizobium hipponense TaxID=2605638 RepID=A0A5S4YBM2_9BRAD|nr:alpha-D-ribose 1-methylphosphonate 5-triphosphate diphosphatase [Bradyrhizobium hipponense]TYO61413.1 alpha-D-ribose 1-methylphosphonate 5-triphosphate diphosphatase [Bradyrhizobium hipponense]